MKRSIILASTSPRRIQMLQDAGIPFTQEAPQGVIEEPKENEAPHDYVRRLALAKANAVHRVHPNSCVLGADTIVVSPEHEILEKPKDRADALRMLQILQGKEHQVVTAYAIVRTDHEIVRAILTNVQFRSLTNEAIEFFLDQSDEWKDKAGSYAVQGIAASFILSLNGSYHNVVGLPLAHVIADLENIFESPYPIFNEALADASH